MRANSLKATYTGSSGASAVQLTCLICKTLACGAWMPEGAC